MSLESSLPDKDWNFSRNWSPERNGAASKSLLVLQNIRKPKKIARKKRTDQNGTMNQKEHDIFHFQAGTGDSLTVYGKLEHADLLSQE